MFSNYRVKPEIQLKDPNTNNNNNININRILKKIYLPSQLEEIINGSDIRLMNEYKNKYYTQFILNTISTGFLMILLFSITEYLTFQLNSPSFHWFAVLIALLTILLIGALFWIRFKRLRFISNWENNLEEGVQVEEKDIDTVTLIQPGNSYQPLKIPSKFFN